MLVAPKSGLVRSCIKNFHYTDSPAYVEGFTAVAWRSREKAYKNHSGCSVSVRGGLIPISHRGRHNP